ncbi:ABC transporter permease [Agromyces larvae]|uniref:Transport permease protein n=1 Tax=Agromyces larvae TaxID=2929802 RepID=A0ABY4C2V0_9MICO|nr:ABC transporter permease [Agromyces larvae]UOE44491.1 ABC transporter permease [Agromyces larvae]
MGYLKELASSRELLSNLVLRDIRGQYKRTVLGRLWSLASPLTAMLVYTFVFSFVFRIQPAAGDPSGLNVFALWLLCGLLPWTFFSSAVSTGMASLVGNAGLITKVYFPRIVLPTAAVLTVGYNWLFEMLVLSVALLIAGSFLWPWIPLVILMMVVLAVFATGVALALSVANVYFRDTQYLLTLVLQVWMYLTPIVYPISLVADQSDRLGGLFGTSVTVLDIYSLNPMLHFVTVFRYLMYDNRLPELSDVLACVVWALVSLVGGFLIFRKNEKGLAETL